MGAPSIINAEAGEISVDHGSGDVDAGRKVSPDLIAGLW